MIVGVGIDTVNIERFAAHLERSPRLLGRLFAAEERRLDSQSLAARFAAKESCLKAFGSLPGFRWASIVVHNDDVGAPRLVLRDAVAEAARRRGVTHVHVSLTHDDPVASAIVILEGD